MGEIPCQREDSGCPRLLLAYAGTSTPLRLVLVDDHEMVLHGLVAMLGHFADEVVIAGQATTAAAALTLVAEERPDVVLCDVRIGKESGLDLCRQITAQYPETKVVLLTVYDDEHYLYQALAGRCLGLHPQADRRPGAGRRICAGCARARPSSTTRWPDGWRCPRPGSARASSGRARTSGSPSASRRCWSCSSPATPTRAVASKLVVSEDTVKTHIRGLYRKLGVSDRSGAIAVALREGLFR